MNKKLMLILLVGFSVQVAASEFAIKGEFINECPELIKAELDKAFWMSMEDEVTLEKSGLKQFASAIIADPSLVDKEHLGTAASENKIDVMQFLLDCGIDIDAQRSCLGTALHRVVRRGDTELLQFLLDRHANCEVRNSGNTPFIEAADSLEPECLQMLFKNGANVHVQDGTGYNAIHRVFSFVDPSVVSKYNYYKTIDTLCDAGLSINSRDYLGFTILHSIMATMFSSSMKVFKAEIAVKKGADVNAVDKLGRTSLFYAFLSADLDDTSSIDFLMSNGALPNVVDYKGNTIFHAIADKNYTLISKALEISENNINALNFAGETALDLVLGNLKTYSHPYLMIDSWRDLGAKSSSELKDEK